MLNLLLTEVSQFTVTLEFKALCSGFNETSSWLENALIDSVVIPQSKQHYSVYINVCKYISSYAICKHTAKANGLSSLTHVSDFAAMNVVVKLPWCAESLISLNFLWALLVITPLLMTHNNTYNNKNNNKDN